MLGEHVGFIRAHTVTSQGSLLLNDKQQVCRLLDTGTAVDYADAARSFP
jgi:hypothetical protein